jgi:hypothetical protein
MSTRAQSQYIRIYSGATTYTRWQNYYVGQSVTWESQSWSYFPFAIAGVTSGPFGNNMIITIPATNAAAVEFNLALQENRLCELRIYEFDSRLTQSGPQSSQDLIAFFTGEIANIAGSLIQWNVTIGSSLASTGAQVPPRKYTNKLIGTPVRT